MTSWKTTLAGAVAAGLYAWANAANMTYKQVAVAVAIAVFGALVKDFNVSGSALEK